MEEDIVTDVNEDLEHLEESPEDSGQDEGVSQTNQTKSGASVDKELLEGPANDELGSGSDNDTSTGDLIEE